MAFLSTEQNGAIQTIFRTSSTAVCHFCGEGHVGAPNSFATITGGGMLRKRRPFRRKERHVMSKRVLGFLAFQWHGADQEMGGVGDHAEVDVYHALTDPASHGQYEIYFCSTRCLRAFLNRCVDEFEWRIGAAGDEIVVERV